MKGLPGKRLRMAAPKIVNLVVRQLAQQVKPHKKQA